MHRAHFIAIGGSVMHDLAAALKENEYQVTGSDDEIYEPARSVLEAKGLLPPREGWFPDQITPDIDAVILGMHAKKDNPELRRAQELGLEIYSFPDFIYRHSLDKQRVVIAGSHGKTTITGIVIHVLSYFRRSFDYIIGSTVPGLERRVRLSADAPVIIIEGDEYLSSAIDPTPKFHKYHHHIGLISGIAWDHANVFHDENEYMLPFERFADATPKGGILIYCESDPLASVIGAKERTDVQTISYRGHPHATEKNRFVLTTGKEHVPICIFGSHNLQNIGGAKELLKKIGITNEGFYEAIQTFEGVAGRLEKVAESRYATLYKDFAHAPSKVKASIHGIKEIYPNRDLVACLELHTFSSLNKAYLPQYADSFKGAQDPLVYFNPGIVRARQLPELSPDDIRQAFGNPAPRVFDNIQELETYLLRQNWKNKNLLAMSSGTFGGLNFMKLEQALSANTRK